MFFLQKKYTLNRNLFIYLLIFISSVQVNHLTVLMSLKQSKQLKQNIISILMKNKIKICANMQIISLYLSW